MITITIFQNQEQYVGFEVSGHAGFAKAGKDIVCAAASILIINTINGIEQFTDDAIVIEVPEEAKDQASAKKNSFFSKKTISDNNRIYFRLTEDISEKTDVLMKTLVLGLKEMNKQYGNSYLTLNFREV